MATTINFDTPASSTARPVAVTGTVAAGSYGLLTITINVTNGVTAARNRSFYREITFDNTGSATSLAVNTSYTMSIVPKVLGSDTVAAVSAWSYTPNN
ncbi:hypothetical protein CLHOM_14450 [Clostridium homopropionicum DSM 5847]|uniref:Uncharacterized protein n=1 Tax=Clostridium homopropionicum DSM 5847 TaxID=1121318 RepID=A0A0L6ZBA5_9CLOT|nr:hypothetical protein [Clostridium homopropionicum]KOA20240.1 hypothetical protein CLHOM_14450 [Clostridium homopropionicum DSM 5847]SFG57934.1 hypothetical protein SAMN04488501_11126 [Clostridium homopropionicum]